MRFFKRIKFTRRNHGVGFFKFIPDYQPKIEPLSEDWSEEELEEYAKEEKKSVKWFNKTPKSNLVTNLIFIFGFSFSIWAITLFLWALYHIIKQWSIFL